MVGNIWGTLVGIYDCGGVQWWVKLGVLLLVPTVVVGVKWWVKLRVLLLVYTV